jgi:hypothetical protein
MRMAAVHLCLINFLFLAFSLLCVLQGILEKLQLIFRVIILKMKYPERKVEHGREKTE